MIVSTFIMRDKLSTATVIH